MAPFGQVTEAFSSLLAQRHLRKYDPAADHHAAEAWLKKHYQPAKRQPASGARMPKLRGERHIVGSGLPLEPGYSLVDGSRAWSDLVEGLVWTYDGWAGKDPQWVQQALHEYTQREGVARGIVEPRVPAPETPAASEGDVDTSQRDKRERGSLTERITSRFSKTQHQAMKRAGITPSEYLRDLVDEDMAMRKATSTEPASLVGQDE